MTRNYLLFTIALFTLLISFQSVITFKRQFNDYQNQLSSSYAIVVIAKAPIRETEIRALFPYLKSIKPIDQQDIIKAIKENLGKEDLKELYEELPLFYRVYFKKLPTKVELLSIEQKLQKLPQVEKVEAFVSAQNKISALIEMIRDILGVFSSLFLVISIILITKQINLWRYMHENRMQVMAILGAKLWFRSKNLFLVAVISSIISTIFTSALFGFLATSQTINLKLQNIGLVPLRYNLFTDTLILLIISLLISLFSISFVILKSEREMQ